MESISASESMKGAKFQHENVAFLIPEKFQLGTVERRVIKKTDQGTNNIKKLLEKVVSIDEQRQSN